jgi:hypothetical protein
MPEIIQARSGRMGKLKRGCGSCHLPNGQGRPENAPPAALPVAYFIRQIHDFRNGLRRSAGSAEAEHQHDDRTREGDDGRGARAVGEILSAIAYRPWTRVVETDVVPTTRIVGILFCRRRRTDRADCRRIDRSAGERRADRAVPQSARGIRGVCAAGSLEKGKDLVTTGGMRGRRNTIVQARPRRASPATGWI